MLGWNTFANLKSYFSCHLRKDVFSKIISWFKNSKYDMHFSLQWMWIAIKFIHVRSPRSCQKSINSRAISNSTLFQFILSCFFFSNNRLLSLRKYDSYENYPFLKQKRPKIGIFLVTQNFRSKSKTIQKFIYFHFCGNFWFIGIKLVGFDVCIRAGAFCHRACNFCSSSFSNFL